MRIQVLSDIHLEFGPLDPPQSDADLAVAAGDIDPRPSRVVEWLSALNKPVVYVAGNHELWGGDFRRRLSKLREACAGSRIHFLERDSVTFGKVTFYGCSLWTDLAGGDPLVATLAGMQMNDFAFITHSGRLLEPGWVTRYNRICRRWLQKSLRRDQNKGRTQVVVTHHAPSLKSWGFAADDPMRYAYCNEMDDLMREQRPALWIHGHVHCRSDYYVLDTRVVCNPRGYFPAGLVETFEPDKAVEV